MTTKRILDKAILTADSKEDDIPLYEYEGSVYENWGKEQRYVGKITHCYNRHDLENIKRDLTYLANRERTVKNLSVKNIKFVKEW